MSKFEITSEDMTDIHNGLVYLRNAIDKLEDTLSPFIIVELRKSKSLIQKGFNAVQTQKDKQWDERNEYYSQLRDNNNFTSFWSMYEIEDVLVHDNFSVPLPVGPVTWFQMWRAADEAIVAVGGDHIFIESLTQSSINPKIILLGTGS